MSDTGKSYGQILKSSSIMGGAAGVNLLLGMIRIKFVAVLIGATGVGLLASFTAMQGIIGTIVGLGIQSSAVREVAAAVGRGDEQAIGRAVLTLRRVCWLTGLVGMAAMAVFSPMLSQLTFGSDKYRLDIAALGIVILLANISGGQLALIQGMRRIGDMARASVFGAALATLAAIGFYSWLGLRGIVPALVSIAAMQLTLSWYFARRVPVPKVTLSWRQTFTEAGGMVRLGLVFMCTGLMGSAVTYITVAIITKQIGLHAVGIYSAAFALSGMFVNFVLGAMAADYYPRLTAVAHDKAAMNRLVNEQTEIGLLLAVPGLLATLALAPWIVHTFYTSEFLPAVELMQWFVLGCLGRVISWPLGFVLIALNKSITYMLCDSFWNSLHIFLVITCMHTYGLKGVSIAFFVLYVVVIIQMMLISKKVTDFQWTHSALKILLFSIVIMLISLFGINYMMIFSATIFGLTLAALSAIYSLRAVIYRLGPNHKFSQNIIKLPLISLVISKRKYFN